MLLMFLLNAYIIFNTKYREVISCQLTQISELFPVHVMDFHKKNDVKTFI